MARTLQHIIIQHAKVGATGSLPVSNEAVDSRGSRGSGVRTLKDRRRAACVQTGLEEGKARLALRIERRSRCWRFREMSLTGGEPWLQTSSLPRPSAPPAPFRRSRSNSPLSLHRDLRSRCLTRSYTRRQGCPAFRATAVGSISRSRSLTQADGGRRARPRLHPRSGEATRLNPGHAPSPTVRARRRRSLPSRWGPAAPSPLGTHGPRACCQPSNSTAIPSPAHARAAQECTMLPTTSPCCRGLSAECGASRRQLLLTDVLPLPRLTGVRPAVRSVAWGSAILPVARHRRHFGPTFGFGCRAGP